MKIVIEIKDNEQAEDLKAVGAADLKKYFLPKAGIRAHSVSIHERTPEETEKMLKGERFRYYKSKA